MTNQPIKLTVPQLHLLKLIRDTPGRHVAQNYPPLKPLLRHAFVSHNVGKYSDGYKITEAGKQYLKSLEPA
jgi:hypothetical protein